MGAIRVCRSLVSAMAGLEGAAVVNTASDLAKQPTADLMDYGTCKGGLLYFTKALAVQYASRVWVNAVLPGPVWSKMWTRPGGIVDQLVAAYGVEDREEALRLFLADRYMPMGIGKPKDVAHAVVFLASRWRSSLREQAWILQGRFADLSEQWLRATAATCWCANCWRPCLGEGI